MRPSAAFAAVGLLSFMAPPSTADVCTSSSRCGFWDDDYHEYILYAADATQIDVLIVPPASPFALRDITTARLAVKGWVDGMNALGQSWFKEGLSIQPWVVGVDRNIPQGALADPEVIIVIAEHRPVVLFGIGQQLPPAPCLARGGALRTLPVHEHGRVAVQRSECVQGGYTCVALSMNVVLAGRYEMYNLIAHEFGHCLGLGHVGDALDFDAKTVPAHDVMSYMSRPHPVNCVSNLNVRSLEGIFAPLLGQPPSTFMVPGQYYGMAPSAYSQSVCYNPPVGSVFG